MSLPTIEIVAIGASTGGPNALAALLGPLPAEFPVPIVIVQHIIPGFTKLLAERLNAKTALLVREAQAATPLRPGEVLVAPGDFHMQLVREKGTVLVRLNQDPPENSCRPSADVLFRSVAEIYGPQTLAVIMTGMGRDGMRGCERVREREGRVFVQDEDSSVVGGMPGFVARAGLAHQVLPLSQLGPEVLRSVQLGRGKQRIATSEPVKTKRDGMEI